MEGTKYAGTASAPEPRRETAMEDLHERIDGTRKTLDLIIDRLTGVAGRALGSEAEGKTQPPRPVRSGAVGVLLDAMDDIGGQLSTLQALASRLETLA